MRKSGQIMVKCDRKPEFEVRDATGRGGRCGPGRAPVRPAAGGLEAKAVAGDRHSKDASHRAGRHPPEPAGSLECLRPA